MAREVPAPQLRETAEIWWDVDHDPVIAWDAAGRRFELVDPEDRSSRLALWVAPAPVGDPLALASALAEGLAACDFPPTAGGPSARVVETVLRAQGVPADGGARRSP